MTIAMNRFVPKDPLPVESICFPPDLRCLSSGQSIVFGARSTFLTLGAREFPQ